MGSQGKRADTESELDVAGAGGYADEEQAGGIATVEA